MVDLRPAVSDDQGFVFSTWLKGLRFGNPQMAKVPARTYFREQHKVITNIIIRGATVLVAHPPDEPGVIVGYVVAEPGVLHWLHVKNAFREMGVGRRLLEAVSPFTEYSHWVRSADALSRKFPASHNPWSA